MVRYVAVAVALAGCGGSKPADPAKTPPPTVFGGDRRVELLVPDGYDDTKAYPLLVMLHGYQTSGLVEDKYQHLEEPALARGMLYARPDGTFDASGARFWNDWTGAHAGATVDDVGYLTKLVADIRAAYHVDDKRIFFTGHSNGGAMTYRMACERADTIAAISILAGDMPVDTSVCKPSAPVTLLDTHGDKDTAVPYDGSAKWLGAKACSDFWAARAGCKASAPAAPLDLVTDQPGAESTVLRWSGCSGGAIELWTVVGAGHIPSFATPTGANTSWAERMLDFLLAHPKP